MDVFGYLHAEVGIDTAGKESRQVRCKIRAHEPSYGIVSDRGGGSSAVAPPPRRRSAGGGGGGGSTATPDYSTPVPLALDFQMPSVVLGNMSQNSSQSQGALQRALATSLSTGTLNVSDSDINFTALDYGNGSLLSRRLTDSTDSLPAPLRILSGTDSLNATFTVTHRRMQVAASRVR